VEKLTIFLALESRYNFKSLYTAYKKEDIIKMIKKKKKS